MSFSIVVTATFVLLFLMTGSVVVPLKAIVMNVLSLGATFGALVLVFQDGHLSGLLGFDPPGALDLVMPVIVFLFAFGESEDAAEGGDLVAGDGAVGLGHLGAKGEDGDGEAHGLFGGGVVAQLVEDHGQGLALGEGGEGFGDAGPDRHVANHRTVRAACQRNFCISTRSM